MYFCMYIIYGKFSFSFVPEIKLFGLSIEMDSMHITAKTYDRYRDYNYL